MLSAPPGVLLFGITVVGLSYGIPMVRPRGRPRCCCCCYRCCCYRCCCYRCCCYRCCCYALLLRLTAPLLQALITAELGTAWPVAGGMAQWVEIGLGEVMGAHNAWWIWVSFIFDAAIYPVMASEYLSTFLGWAEPNVHGGCDAACLHDQNLKHLYASFIVIAMTFVKLLGREALEKISGVLAICTLTPSMIYIFTALGKGYFDVKHLTSTDSAPCNGGMGQTYGFANGSTDEAVPGWSKKNYFPEVKYVAPTQAQCGSGPTYTAGYVGDTCEIEDGVINGKGVLVSGNGTKKGNCQLKDKAPECWTEKNGCKSCNWTGGSCHATDYALLVSFIMWLYAGFLSLGTLAGELEDPAGTYVNAILLLTPVVLFINCFPLIVSMSIDHNRNNFHPGHFQTLATFIVGDWMKAVYFAGSQVSLYGLYNSTVIMAECTIPPFFEKYFAYMGFRPNDDGVYRSTTCNFLLTGKSEDEPGKFYVLINMLVAICLVWCPYVLSSLLSSLLSFLLSSLLTSLLSSLLTSARRRYAFLVEVTMLLMVIMTYPFLLTFVWLRHTQPHVERPFKLPGGTFEAVLWTMPPFLISTFYLIICVFVQVDPSFNGAFNFFHINLNVWCLIATIVIGLAVQLVYTNCFSFCRDEKNLPFASTAAGIQGSTPMGRPGSPSSYRPTKWEDLPEVSPRVITGPSYRASPMNGPAPGYSRRERGNSVGREGQYQRAE